MVELGDIIVFASFVIDGAERQLRTRQIQQLMLLTRFN
jgi:hypothetical protein